DQEAAPAIDLHPSHRPAAHALVEVPGEGVLGLVVVVGEVEDPRAVGHRRPPRSLTEQRSAHTIETDTEIEKATTIGRPGPRGRDRSPAAGPRPARPDRRG